MAGDEQLGVLCCLANDGQFTEEDEELLGAVANQTAVGLKKAELIERLTAENIVKDMFDALAAGSVEDAEAKAAEASCDLDQAAPVPPRRARTAMSARRAAAWPDLATRLEARAAPDRPAGVLRLPPRPGPGAGSAAERPGASRSSACAPPASRWPRAEALVIGLSEVDSGAPSARRRMREAADAARIGRSLVAEGGAVSYEQLGAYRYLVHLELDDAPRDRYRQSVEKLREYDRRRGARLIETLERYLADRGSVAASARALYVHPEHGSPAPRADRAGRGIWTSPRRICCRWSWR